ncbi:MAG TPA: urate hydroxylase PuuD [Spongiibacteraceae bacterium]|jgi:uncharacterized membrane protein|nr:urate hydroxylase PuuD [Spongiibacteraceae bacterium]
MDNILSVDLLLRWLHVLFGVTWIGLLYYFNFIQGEYFKEAEPGAKADATAKLAPRALFYFRWSAMFTFITGLLLFELIRQGHGINGFIAMGALMGTLMFLNVWLIIWPNQKIVVGIKAGDKARAGARALLASRTNTLFSASMLLGMMGSNHGVGAATTLLLAKGHSEAPGLGLWVVLGLTAALQLNAMFGKTGPMQSVVGVIHLSLLLAVVNLLLLQFL